MDFLTAPFARAEKGKQPLRKRRGKPVQVITACATLVQARGDMRSETPKMPREDPVVRR